MQKELFLNKFAGQVLTCNECKKEFNSDHQKLHIGKKGKCFNCDSRMIFLDECGPVLLANEVCHECNKTPLQKMEKVKSALMPDLW